jgi:hypothetical protein
MWRRSVTMEIAGPAGTRFAIHIDFRRLSEWQGQSGLKGTDGAFDPILRPRR